MSQLQKTFTGLSPSLDTEGPAIEVRDLVNAFGDHVVHDHLDLCVNRGEVMGIVGDHHSSPQAVCLHPDESHGDEAAAIVFSMVCDVEARRMWVTAGNPCTEPFEEIDLSDVIPRP